MEQEYRIEKDSLGEVQVPKDALYGAQTMRALQNFPISGGRPRPVYVRAMVLIKKAAALVNTELGGLDPDISRAICQAADEVLNGQWLDQFVVDPFQAGAGTSHNMNVNEVLARRAAIICGKTVHPNDHVNMAQSTNDVIPTAIRIGCLSMAPQLDGALCGLADGLSQKAQEFDDVLKSGRTHLQDAVPIRLGQEFGAYARAVRRDAERIRHAAENLKELGIGGTAVGSGLNAQPHYHEKMVRTLSELCELDFKTSDNLFERMQSMADMADFSASLKTTALTLIRIANDFRLLASGPGTGLNELILPALQPGSSIMPGKVNPVMAEMLDMVMFQIIGNDCVISLATQAGQLELNVMMPVIATNLFESLTIMTNAVNAFCEKCVRGLGANRERARYWLEQNAIIATALNPLIGYQNGAELVKKATAEKRSIRDVTLEAAREGRLISHVDGKPVTETMICDVLDNMREMTGPDCV